MDTINNDSAQPSELLQTIVKSITPGDTLFREQLAHLTSLLHARHAYLTEVIDPETLRIFASLQDYQRGPTQEYCTLGTPCADVIRDGIQVVDQAIAERYPNDEYIREHGFASYVGCPLVDSNNQTIGHLCVYGDECIKAPDTAALVVSLFAARISAELQHRRDQRQLAEQERSLEILLGHLPGMVYRCKYDRRWTMHFVSAGCELLSGYPRETFEQGDLGWVDIIHPDDRDRVWEEVELALTAGKNFDIQYRILTQSGVEQWVWEQGCGVTVHNEPDEVVEGFITDITPLKVSERALARSEAFSKAIVSTAVDSIITIDAQGRIELFNHSAEALFGYSQSEIIGENIRMLMPEPHSKNHDQYMNSYLETGKAKIIGVGRELTARRKDGSLVPIYLSISEITPNGGRWFTGIVRDLSEQKAVEEELRRGHERLKVTIEHAPTGIVTYRHGEPFMSANRAFCKITGYSSSELKRMTVWDLTHPEDRAESAAKVETGEVERFSQRKRYVRKDGSIIDIGVVSSVTHDSDGRPDLIIGQVEDLTPRLNAEAEAREHREQLAHADRLNTLGEMASGIAHEINQPLTAISLFAQAGKRLLEAGNYGRLEEVFGKLSQQAQRAGAVIERVESMVRQQESVRAVVDCNALVEEVAELAEAEAHIHDISIEVETVNELPLVVVDAVQIQQVALNLLRNGMEAMRSVDCRDGNTITLQTKLRGDGDIEVVVTDKGCGVSKEVEKTLFRPFSTTKRSGMGMGLSISRSIIAAHGGRLDFHNNDSGGATFLFTLPSATKEKENG